MCGIAGFFGDFSEVELREASEALAHRGPDDSGLYLNGVGVGLAHRRLSIIDLTPTGAQPMLAANGGACLVFNGEIYNFRELRSELDRLGAKFRGTSDTEVLLQLYLSEGEEMLPRLNGIFGFALWDPRDESLLIARDAMGVKPLYYACTPRGFVFASELKALLRLLPDTRLDPVALHRYLTFLWCPGSRTPLRAVQKLLPGEALRVRNRQIDRRWTWYRLPFFDHGREMVDEHQAIEGTANHLREAVRRQLVADVPVGSFLSGGLDSSAIVAFAREASPGIRCFTIDARGRHDDGFVSDLPFARRVAEHLDVPLEVVAVDADAMSSDLEQMIWQLDEPLADPAPLNVLYISELARQHGMKVLLSGAGGDDLFSGYRRHVALQLEPYWRWLPRSVRSQLRRGVSGLDQRSAFRRRIQKLFDGASLEGDARITNYFRWIREPDLMQLYTPAFRGEIGAEPVDGPMLDLLGALPAETGALNRMLALEQRFFLPDHNLTYTDKMSMAVGVEVRVPFLDLDLVRFTASIPEGLKQRGRTSKWVLKKAMESHLPPDVIYRPKTGFGAPLRSWMRGDLRAAMSDLLSTESLKFRGVFEPKAVHELIQRNARGEIDAAYTLLSLMTLEIWCRKFLHATAGVGCPRG